ncbi:hypothetical protein LTR16_010274, partial [Cryomyces antarcticus]
TELAPSLSNDGCLRSRVAESASMASHPRRCGAARHGKEREHALSLGQEIIPLAKASASASASVPGIASFASLPATGDEIRASLDTRRRRQGGPWRLLRRTRTRRASACSVGRRSASGLTGH